MYYIIMGGEGGGGGVASSPGPPDVTIRLYYTSRVSGDETRAGCHHKNHYNVSNIGYIVFNYIKSPSVPLSYNYNSCVLLNHDGDE